VLQCVVARRSVLKCIAVCCSVFQTDMTVILLDHEINVLFRHHDLNESCHKCRRLFNLLYGVASVSRIDKSIGLFCKRAL